MTALSRTAAVAIDNDNNEGFSGSNYPKPRLHRGPQRSQTSEPSNAQAPELVWPVPADDLAKVVFDSQHPESATVAPASKPQSPENPAEHSTPPPPRTRTAFSWWLPLLLVVTAFETTYLGIRAADDWRRRDASAAVADVLTARSIVSPWTASLPGSALDDSTELGAGFDRTTSLSLTPVEPAVERPGWVSINLPFQVEIYEGGRFIGTSEYWRVGLAAGQHVLELVNESLGYRATASVNVRPGEVTPLSVTLPSGLVSLNALPWGTVLIDGKSVGDTPIGNLEVPIGPHRIAFQHPELGEETRSVLITAGAVTRLSVDLRK